LGEKNIINPIEYDNQLRFTLYSMSTIFIYIHFLDQIELRYGRRLLPPSPENRPKGYGRAPAEVPLKDPAAGKGDEFP
jgi:hypothetical protein